MILILNYFRQLLDDVIERRVRFDKKMFYRVILLRSFDVLRLSQIRQHNHRNINVLLAQGIFYSFFFLLYVISTKTAHRVVGYLEEDAVHSYTEYLAGVDNGTYANIPAPEIAIDYWKLPPDARLRDVIIAVRADETRHRDVNHEFADELNSSEQP